MDPSQSFHLQPVSAHWLNICKCLYHPQDKHLTHYCMLNLRLPGLHHGPLSQNFPSEQWEIPARPRAPYPSLHSPSLPPTYNPVTNCTKCTEQRLGRSLTSDKMPKVQTQTKTLAVEKGGRTLRNVPRPG